MKQTISIIGCTGSIGQQAIELLQNYTKQYSVNALIAAENYKLLASNAIKTNAQIVVIANKEKYPKLKEILNGHKVKILSGEDGVKEACSTKIDRAIMAISGFSGINAIVNTIGNCKIMAIANKEPMVCAGKIIMKMAQDNGTQIIPLDSEHHAISRLLKGSDINEIKSFTITASGGPFLGYTKQQLQNVTPKMSELHPIWKMGEKISIDSATLMNKALELIEAHNLFNIEPKKLNVLIHPQALIHALLTYQDSSVSAIINTPDMKIPISSIFTWPKIPVYNNMLDIEKLNSIRIYKPNQDHIRVLKIAGEAMQHGGNYPTIINAANEIAVDAFMHGKILFNKIIDVIEETINLVPFNSVYNINDVIIANHSGRRAAKNIIESVKIL
ncbi:1-deoxy-D-xylulose 5-phosphate reductoisomerase [Candidatus Xenohaliotis californiensis]|uniref:1-deoxy-D-xylulose 5-phosphate reductoisomerase n=1 Tax=Candidatus Xenohaliotis californiensis TaxID=84677 RepID=A0ABP0EVM5_9RICK|nr:1-deoxy-D-xylulose 5-phosphate reductoisomerase [Candidatus Xenohaliotis californiensis]